MVLMWERKVDFPLGRLAGTRTKRLGRANSNKEMTIIHLVAKEEEEEARRRKRATTREKTIGILIAKSDGQQRKAARVVCRQKIKQMNPIDGCRSQFPRNELAQWDK